MEPKHLSASAIQTFEGCEARYASTHLGRTPDVSGTAADLGTACHEALELYVAENHHLVPDSLNVLELFYRDAYNRLFTDDSRRKEGLDMLRNWYSRQDWTGRTVLSTEQRETFDLKFTTDDGEKKVIPVTYILDRCDQLADGSIEVIDYKTVMAPVSHDDMRNRIQPRLYALAMQLKHPDAPRVWMTYDLLRYEPVGVVFTKDENRDTYRYLQDVARRIHASDGTTETLNAQCRWCVRKASCETLTANAEAGGIMSISSVEEAVRKKMLLDSARGGIEALRAELDEYILQAMEEAGDIEMRTPEAEVKITARATRVVDSQRVFGAVGADVASRYGNLTVAAVTEMLKAEDLDDNQRSQVKQAITKRFGNASIKITPLTDFESE